jgi:membrane protease YdiL (CAAX protease family)
MLITYLLLALTVLIALFNRQRKILYFCITITNLVALYSTVMTLQGAVWVIILATLAILYFQHEELGKIYRYALLLSLMGILTGFTLYKLPGYNRLLMESVILSPASNPLVLFFNFEKVNAALIVYACSRLIIAEKIPDIASIKQTCIILLTCILVILTPAIVSGYVKYDPKLPGLTLLWGGRMFLFICFAEEVIFRGFLQNTIRGWFTHYKRDYFLPIIITSIIFGLAHYRDGTIFMVLAAICGLFYGYTYQRTNRILCAMLVHFGLNFTHFIFFTYPSAAKLLK